MLLETAAALLDKPVSYNLQYIRPFNFLPFFGRNRSKELNFRPLYLGTLLQLSEYAIVLEKHLPKGVPRMPEFYKFISHYTGSMAAIIALASRNQKELATENDIDELERILTSNDLRQICHILSSSIDVASFYDFYQLHRKKDNDDASTQPGSRTMWGAIGGMMKYFRFSWNQVLWEISYQNTLMLSATIPVYQGSSDKKKTDERPEATIDSGQELFDYLGIKNQ